MKRTIFVLTAGLFATGLAAQAAPSCVDPTALAACTALGGGMMLNFDCKAFDGSPQGITGVRVCVNGETATLLITNTQGQVDQERETDSQRTATTFTYVASDYALEIPMSPQPNAQFDAIMKLPAINGRAQTAPLVCTGTN